MNPNHTIPVMNDNGFVLFESRAMMVYLINQYKPDSTLYPKEPKARAKVDEVLYFDASALFPALKACVVSLLFFISYILMKIMIVGFYVNALAFLIFCHSHFCTMRVTLLSLCLTDLNLTFTVVIRIHHQFESNFHCCDSNSSPI